MYAVALAGCSSPGTAVERAPVAWGEAVDVSRRFVLQENDEVITVSPSVQFDPRGGFLVADGPEGQVRRYGEGGELLWKAGARGGGPGEFSNVQNVLRLRSGEIFAADFQGRFTVFDSAAGQVVSTIQSPLSFVEDLQTLSDSTLLISGILDGDPAAPRLHVWNVRNNRITRSFFAPFPRSRNEVAATIAGWAKASVRGDTVAAIFALSDSVHLFTTAGKPVRSIPLPSTLFRRVGTTVPSDGADPRRRAAWLSSFDYVADVFWTREGDLLVPYQSIVPDGAYTREWHLLRLGRTGEGRLEMRSVPRLLAVNPRTDHLYFVAPGAEAENEWVLARLR
ncbi:MAG TPA: hypothetical protein VF665_06125 [Longimicrobium sp.]|jgi:hypothetical protein|uniref:hypothetical protein n=1 Tax=Longimicrobium sp. TaxID=2029185 RepID=UPI002EDA994A